MQKINNLHCDECEENIKTFDFYMIALKPNKNNGKYLLLCGDCARELKMELNCEVR